MSLSYLLNVSNNICFSQVLWRHIPAFTPEQTIMFDDIRRNFLLNPQVGLKIRPFRNAPQVGHKDTELLKLTE
jgi:ubiquitin-like domain-containing CTD phosphatase 1